MKEDLQDREVVGHALELSRPELRPILDRYVPRDALFVVGQSDTSPLEEAFLAAGWRVHTCHGPGRTRCPLLGGKECPLRESADIAVVYVDPRMSPGGGALPRLRCAADSASPAVVALEHRASTPRINGPKAVVGAHAEPGRIVALADSLARGTAEDASDWEVP